MLACYYNYRGGIFLGNILVILISRRYYKPLIEFGYSAISKFCILLRTLLKKLLSVKARSSFHAREI